MLHSCLWS